MFGLVQVQGASRGNIEGGGVGGLGMGSLLQDLREKYLEMTVDQGGTGAGRDMVARMLDLRLLRLISRIL